MTKQITFTTISLLLAIVLIVVAGCGKGRDQQGAGHGEHLSGLEAAHAGGDGREHTGEGRILKLSKQQSEEFGIELEQAAGGVLTRRIRLPGEIKLNEDRLVHVVPRLPGVVREVRSSLGDKVRVGQVMAVIESWELAEVAAEHVAATIRLELAGVTFERERDLYARKITSLEDFLAAKLKMVEARIQMEKAQQKHQALDLGESDHGKGDGGHGLPSADYRIVAPMNGTVIGKHISLGEVLKADTEAFLLADLSTVWIDLSVYRKDLPFVRQGGAVTISAGHGIPDVEVAIDYLGPLVGEATRTALARVVLENRDGLWRPGLFVTAMITANETVVSLLVPKTALLSMEGETFVFVGAGSGFELKPVEVGRENETHVEIISGLEPGEQYVGSGAFTLKSELEKASFGGEGHAH